MFTFRINLTLLPVVLSIATAAEGASMDELSSISRYGASEALDLTAGEITALFGQLDGGGPFYDERGRVLGKRGFYRMPDEAGHDVGDLPGGISETIAYGSNAAGQIVGQSAVDGGTHAFVWQESTGMIDLGDLPGGAVAGMARDINAEGTVVGTGATAHGPHAFLWKPAAGMWDMNDLIEDDTGLVLREALTIGASGRVAGWAEDSTGMRAFIWDPATGLLDLSDPAAAASLDSTPQNMSALRFVEVRMLAGAGEVAVGRALSEGGQDRPVLWTSGAALRDLGDLPGETISGVAHGVNAATQVVGHALTANGERAFLWEAESGIVDLNSMILPYKDVVLHRAVDIDDRGRILAYGRKGTAIHYFLMAPDAIAGDGAIEIAAAEVEAASDTFEKGGGAGGYALVDLGEFLLTQNMPPALAMDETGRIVGGCDLLTAACPYLSDNVELVTSLLDDGITNFFDGTGSVLGPRVDLSPAPGPTPLSTDIGPVGSSATRPIRSDPPPLPPIGGTFGREREDHDSPPNADTPPPYSVNSPGTLLVPVPLPPAVAGLLLALGLLGGLGRRKSA